jgi:hypothetical protein
METTLIRNSIVKMKSILIACLLLSLASIWATQEVAAARVQPSFPEGHAIGAWKLVREYDGGNNLYAERMQADRHDRVLLRETGRPVVFLHKMGALWVLLDTGVARSGSTVFVVYVPTEGTPFTVLESNERESGISMADSVVDCRTEDGRLSLQIESEDAEAAEGKRYMRTLALQLAPAPEGMKAPSLGAASFPTDMNGRTIRCEYDAARGAYYLTTHCGAERVWICSSSAPIQLLAAAPPYLVCRHAEGQVFVVYVPQQGKPFVAFKSGSAEAGIRSVSYVSAYRVEKQKLFLKLFVEEAFTKKNYIQSCTIDIEDC